MEALFGMGEKEVSPRRQVLSACRRALEARRNGYSGELRALDEAAARETKSSAGDKYETAREMIAQSRNLSARNLAETEAALAVLERMEAEPARDRVGFGSLVETSLGWYLVGLSLGDMEAQGRTVRTLSLASPLGLALKGKCIGERFAWRGAELAILGLPS